jgi:hypothetical protein
MRIFSRAMVATLSDRGGNKPEAFLKIAARDDVIADKRNASLCTAWRGNPNKRPFGLSKHVLLAACPPCSMGADRAFAIGAPSRSCSAHW